MIKHEFTLTYPDESNRAGEVVSGDVRFIDDGTSKPLVVISHGFKTSKEWGIFPVAGEYFAKKGFVSVVLNFARNGVRPGEKKITNWDLFSKNSPSLGIEDLHFVLDAIEEGALEFYGIDVFHQPCILIGHSGGGGLSLITATERRDVSGVVLWSSIATFDRFSREEKQVWRKQEWLEFMSDDEHGMVKIGLESLDDLEQNKERLNVIDAARLLDKPVLIIHGTDDTTVPIQEARQLRSSVTHPESESMFLERVDHLYGIQSPYNSEINPTLQLVLENTFGWLQKFLHEKIEQN